MHTVASKSIDDRWHVPLLDENGKRTGRRQRSDRYGVGRRWRARYRDLSGKEHARHFETKPEAVKWLDSVTASLVRGDYLDPENAEMTVGEWVETWLAGYGTRKASTVRQARTHCRHITDEFGARRLRDLRPSDVKAWTAKLAASGKAQSTVYVIYRRLVQVLGDAVEDGIMAKSPCSRRTSPPAPGQRVHLLTTEQVWALHDAMPEHLRPAVLLGAFAGLRVSEVVNLRVDDVDFEGGILRPSGQVKTERSRDSVAVPVSLTERLSEHVDKYGAATVVTDEIGRKTTTWAVQEAVRVARETVEGLPSWLRFHDLRHFYASTLIRAGCDVKIVQRQMRHANATTTLRVYAHMWPDADESARAAIAFALTARADQVRTKGGVIAADLQDSAQRS